jgi:hypothetical protein
MEGDVWVSFVPIVPSAPVLGLGPERGVNPLREDSNLRINDEREREEWGALGGTLRNARKKLEMETKEGKKIEIDQCSRIYDGKR